MSEIRAGKAFVETFMKDGVSGGLDKVEKRLKRFSTNTQAIGRKMFGTGLSLAAPLLATIGPASKLEETLNKFNVVFGDNRDAVLEWGRTFADEIGRSEEQIARFLAGSQDLFVPLGFDESTATDFSKTLTKLSIDLASFNNMSDERVLTDLHAALTGSGETMKKYGVLVNEAAVKQELLNQSIDPKSATDQEKVMSRLAIIMRGTTAAQGDAKRSAGSFENQMKRLKGELNNAAAAAGSAFLPALSSLVGHFTVAVKGATVFIKNNKGLVTSIALAAGGLIGLGTALITLGTSARIAAFGVGGLRKMFGLTMGPMKLFTVGVGTAKGAVFGLFGIMQKLIGLPFRLALTGIKSVASGGLLRGLLGAAFSPAGLIAGGGVALGAALVASMGGLSNLRQGFEALRDRAVQAWESIRASASEAWAGMKSAAVKSYDAIISRIGQGDLKGAMQVAMAGIETIWSEVVGGFAPQWSAMSVAMGRIWNDSISLLSDAWAGFREMFSGTAKFLESNWNSFVAFLTGNPGVDDVAMSWNDFVAGMAINFNNLHADAKSFWALLVSDGKKAARDLGETFKKTYDVAMGKGTAKFGGKAVPKGNPLKPAVDSITGKGTAKFGQKTEDAKKLDTERDQIEAQRLEREQQIHSQKDERNRVDAEKRQRAIEDAKRQREEARKILDSTIAAPGVHALEGDTIAEKESSAKKMLANAEAERKAAREAIRRLGKENKPVGPESKDSQTGKTFKELQDLEAKAKKAIEKAKLLQRALKEPHVLKMEMELKAKAAKSKGPGIATSDTVNGRSLSELKAELEGRQAAALKQTGNSAATVRSGEAVSRIYAAMNRSRDGVEKKIDVSNDHLKDIKENQELLADTIEESISFEVIA